MNFFAKLSALFIAAIPLPAVGDTTLDPIQVRGHRIDGGPTILCTGDACAAVLRGLFGKGYTELTTSDPPLEDGTDANFCTMLQAKRDPTCSASSPPPSVPGVDPNWSGNGCGSVDGGDTEYAAVNAFLSLNPAYTGDPSVPYPNVDFTDACNAHDNCWGRAGDFASCNTAFQNALNAVCGNAGTSQDNCKATAPIYVAAVQSTFGQQNYGAAVRQRECAHWHKDMEQNNCNN